ncbi:MAG TPA: Gar1/Naf1 family protein [Nitrososphaerales archaeon]|nr:Gar1/Naf1 family protein [Nitrososphaerales archaeon]
MQEVGEVLHRAKSGRLIILLSRKVEPGAVLLDSKGRNAARVVELIGPVSKPYASAAPASDRAGTGKDGRKVFLG